MAASSGGLVLLNYTVGPMKQYFGFPPASRTAQMTGYRKEETSVCVCARTSVGGVFMQKIWPTQKQPFVLTLFFQGLEHIITTTANTNMSKSLKRIDEIYNTFIIFQYLEYKYKYWNPK